MIGNLSTLNSGNKQCTSNISPAIPITNIPFADNITLPSNCEVHIITDSGRLEGAVTFSLGEAVNGLSNEWIVVIAMGETEYDVVLPEIQWTLGIAPSFSANTTTEIRLYYMGNALKGVWNT